jgi:hypothetical protein
MPTDVKFEKQVAECTKLHDEIEKHLYCKQTPTSNNLTEILLGANDLENFGGWDAIILLGVDVNDIKSVIFINEKPSEEYYKMFKKEHIPIYYLKTVSDKPELLL